MALEATFRGLTFCLHRLHDALNELEVTLGDKPPDDESAMADGLESAVLDLIGKLHEARKTALKALRAIAHPPDLDRARRALTLCQNGFHCIEGQYAAELISYENLRELAHLGKERRNWMPWATTVKQEIEQCRPPLQETSKALAACWQELVEHSGNTSISVTNTGQRIVAHSPLSNEAMHERMT